MKHEPLNLANEIMLDIRNLGFRVWAGSDDQQFFTIQFIRNANEK